MNKEERALREASLLAAALNCFATERWEDVSVARIAKLAGVAKGTVYLHFASKDEICARLALDFYDELQKKYEAATSQTGITGRARLAGLIKTSFSHYLERKQYKHIVEYCQREHFLNNLSAELSQSLQNIEHCRRRQIGTALDQGAHDKSLKPDAAEHLTGVCCTIKGALNSFSSSVNTDKQEPMKFMDEVTAYILATVESATVESASVDLTSVESITVERPNTKLDNVEETRTAKTTKTNSPSLALTSEV